VLESASHKICLLPQTAAFEPEAAEAAPYKSAVAAAAEVVGILEGTGRANPKKGGAGSLPELNAVPQVRRTCDKADAIGSKNKRSGQINFLIRMMGRDPGMDPRV